MYGGTSFYQRKEIKDLIAYFRLTFNPNDEEAIKRVINYPRRGIGATSLDRIRVAADQRGITLRSEERRVGKECVSTCTYRRSPYPYTQTHQRCILRTTSNEATPEQNMS